MIALLLLMSVIQKQTRAPMQTDEECISYIAACGKMFLNPATG
jgi:hypothetical protein